MWTVNHLRRSCVGACSAFLLVLGCGSSSSRAVGSDWPRIILVAPSCAPMGLSARSATCCRRGTSGICRSGVYPASVRHFLNSHRRDRATWNRSLNSDAESSEAAPLSNSAEDQHDPRSRLNFMASLRQRLRSIFKRGHRHSWRSTDSHNSEPLNRCSNTESESAGECLTEPTL